jgi:hypothetical protein
MYLKVPVKTVEYIMLDRGVTLLVSVDISTHALWITQNEQHFVAGKICHELDAQLVFESVF